MATNLHLLLLLCLTPPCPPEVEELVASGWRAYRADSMAVAAERFSRADQLCENLDAKVGLGYALLRLDRLVEADSLFRLVVATDSGNADGWDGLTIVRWRQGDARAAVEAGRRALQLNPGDETARAILTQADPDWERPPVPPPVRPKRLRIDARTKGDYFQTPSGGGGWRRFYVSGVNMGVALPGKFPSEFPPDSVTYAGWFDIIAGMHANTLRLYTILPPSFYRALYGWNTGHPDRPLWLIHGVWTELPPNHDFNDSTWTEEFHQEMRRVVDLLHGNADFPARPGHAGGRYDADLSRWTLGYIIGREWEPFAVKEFEQRFRSKPTGYAGRFLATKGGLHMDAWMAEQCDYLLGYEVDRYNTIRPIAYTNWPTLDPLFHITESTADEEAAWRLKVGHAIERPLFEYENDAIGLDAMKVRPTSRNPAGWFASYHAYPYYPDFMLNDPVYNTVRSSEGRSNYFGYLRHLKRHHAGMPLLLSEYGVPSSRGNAHLQPQGWDHGGHDEVAMARIDARLTREIRESGAAGGILFAWIDEWFKKNWIVIDYEIPLENTRQWHNIMDAEQNYGILGMYAGEDSATPEPGGDPAHWKALPVLEELPDATANLPRRLRVGQNESYLYLAVEIAEFAGRPFPWRDQDLMIALDTYRRGLGQRSLPGGVISGDLGFEFVAILRDTADAELRITPDYNPYAGGDAIIGGDDYGRFGHRPVTTVPRDDGRFDSLFVMTNRARFGRDGRFFPAQGLNRGRLRYGTAARSTLSDWYWDQEEGMLELRLPWNLINVGDPSSKTILYEEPNLDVQTSEAVGTAPSDGFRIGVAVLGRTRASYGEMALIGALPAPVNGRWRSVDFPDWQWSGWTMPRYHQRLKPVYDSLKAVWSGWH
jgi:hypothetical protein